LLNAKETVSDQSQKPVLDEQTLGRLLEAAYVLQEHNRELRQRELSLQLQSDQLRERETSQASPRQSQTSLQEESPPGEDYTLTLAQIVETQRQIQVRHLGLDDAMALVTKHVVEIAHASGAAIGILQGNKIRYRSATGSSALTPGSEVPMERALCFGCLRTGDVIRCGNLNSDFLLDADECRRRGIEALIAVPIYDEDGIAGGLELYFAPGKTFTDQDVHTCQLMAGLVTETFTRDTQVALKKSVAPEHATMLQTLEKLKPSLAALLDGTVAKESSTPDPKLREQENIFAAEAPGHTYICRKCGHELVGEEQFCGKCGSPRAADYGTPSLQSKVALMWEREQASKPSTGNFPSTGNLAQVPSQLEQDPEVTDEFLQPLAVPDLRSRTAPDRLPETCIPDENNEEELQTETATEPDKIHAQETALAKSGSGLAWSSAARAREFLEQLSQSRQESRLTRFWNTHRGEIYLAVAVLLVAAAIRWGVGSNHSPTATSGTVASSQRKVADADLTLFDKLLIKLGVAEAPDVPESKGNPDTQVWVDLHTALYYCPGADLYGKTPKGKFTSQRDAQMDQFEPAYRKVCN
jgi:GAF domain-containing protein